MVRNAYTDGRDRAEDFEVGDRVRILNERSGNLSGWVGTIVNIDETAGVVSVDAPFGEPLRYRAEIVFPEDGSEVGVGEETSQQQLKDLDQQDLIESRVASRHLSSLRNLTAAVESCREQDLDEVQTYRALISRYGGRFSDHEITQSIRSVFEPDLEERVAKNVSKLAARGHEIDDEAHDLLSSL